MKKITALSIILVLFQIYGCKTNVNPLSDEAYDTLIQSDALVEEADAFTVGYQEGYNLNFEITKEQASALLPNNLTPYPIKIVESDDQPRYYLSWYMAVLDSNPLISVSRIDLFTYAKNKKGELSLHFVSSYMKLPGILKNNPSIKEIFDFFAEDTRTGEPSYPHYYTDLLTTTHDSFELGYEGAHIESKNCAPLKTNDRFTRDFVVANSQITRNEVDKNVNYFNQSFVDVNVETRDPSCVTYENLQGFHPALNSLKSIQFYGSKKKKITWYYEMCVEDDCTSPFNKG